MKHLSKFLIIVGCMATHPMSGGPSQSKPKHASKAIVPASPTGIGTGLFQYASSVNMVSLLVERGADVSQEEATKILAEKVFPMDGPDRRLASVYQPELITWYIKHKNVDVNQYYNGHTLLHICITPLITGYSTDYNLKEKARLLIQHKALLSITCQAKDRWQGYTVPQILKQVIEIEGPTQTLSELRISLKEEYDDNNTQRTTALPAAITNDCASCFIPPPLVEVIAAYTREQSYQELEEAPIPLPLVPYQSATS